MSYGSDKAGIWRSGDYGDTWTNITPANFPSSFSRMVVGGAPSNDNIVYLIGDLGSSAHALCGNILMMLMVVHGLIGQPMFQHYGGYVQAILTHRVVMI